MAKPVKRKVPGGRVTPKAAAPKVGAPKAVKATRRTTPAPPPTSRYTPPIPRELKVSSIWVPIIMFTLLGLGVLVIIANYLGLVPGDTSNWYLLAGLGLILAGIITATQYH